MKKGKLGLIGGVVFTALGCAMVVMLLLTGCGEKKPFEPAAAAQALTGSGAFSEELEELDRDMYVWWYGLEDATLTDGVVRVSTGATAEEFAVLVFTTEEAAQKGEEALKAHVADQLEANRDYRPEDVPKLEKAVVERRKNTVLLLVAKDYGAVEKILD